jgi:hypothetical protein
LQPQNAGGHQRTHPKASTQYADWEGTASADDAHDDLHAYLSDKAMIGANEFLLGASLFGSEGFTHIRAFVFRGDTFEAVPKDLAAIDALIPVLEIEAQLTREEFLAF